MRELALIPKKKKLIQILRLFIREKIGIKNSINRSLTNLKTTYLDSVILHNPERYVLEGKSDFFKYLNTIKMKPLLLSKKTHIN